MHPPTTCDCSGSSFNRSGNGTPEADEACAAADEDVRHISRADQLAPGDQVFTPARRWETVTRADLGQLSDWSVSIFTDRTGPEYAWSLPRHRELPTLRAWMVRGTAVVWVVSDAVRGEVIAFVGRDDVAHHEPPLYVVAGAYPAGRGRGWELRHRPQGGALVSTVVPSKAAAASAVKRIAKEHAAALGLRMHRPGVAR